MRTALSKSRIQADHADALARSKEQLVVLIAHDLRRLCLGLVALNIAEDLAIARVALSDARLNYRAAVDRPVLALLIDDCKRCATLKCSRRSGKVLSIHALNLGSLTV